MDRGICEYFYKCEFYRCFCKEESRRKRIDLFHEYISPYCYGEMKEYCRHWETFSSDSIVERPRTSPTGIRIIFSNDIEDKRKTT